MPNNVICLSQTVFLLTEKSKKMFSYKNPKYTNIIAMKWKIRKTISSVIYALLDPLFTSVFQVDNVSWTLLNSLAGNVPKNELSQTDNYLVKLKISIVLNVVN